jgi:hypothetical protein
MAARLTAPSGGEVSAPIRACVIIAQGKLAVIDWQVSPYALTSVGHLLGNIR